MSKFVSIICAGIILGGTPLIASAAPLQVACSGSLTQSDNGATDSYACAGNLTLSDGVLTVTDNLEVDAQGNLDLVDAVIQAQNITLDAQGSLSIDAGSSLSSPGSSGNNGSLVLTSGGVNTLLGSYNAASVTSGGASLQVGSGGTIPTTGSGSIIDSTNSGQVVTNSGSLVLTAPEPDSWALALLGMTVISWVRRSRKLN